jgi:hypothetical protein
MPSDEEKQMIDEIIADDKAMTVEQRNEFRRAERLSCLKLSVARINKLIELNAPKVIIAGAVMVVYHRAWTLWEKQMASEHADWMIDKFRKGAGRCTSCGDELPLPFGENESCPKCVKEQDELQARYCEDGEE